MSAVGFVDLLAVVLVALLAPLVVRLVPVLRIPSPVLEIVAGIVLGPSVLGWVRPDTPVQVLALIGLAFLLFLAGLEIDVPRLRGRPVRLALLGFAVSLVLALAVGALLQGVGLTTAGPFVAIVLCATSLGLVVPVLKDADAVGGATGQLVIAAASIADFGAVILLSVFFSGESTGLTAKLLLLGGLLVVAGLVVLTLARVEASAGVMRVLTMLADTTAQIRIRVAVVLLIGFVALAQGFGFEAILGAFLAGAALRLVDPHATEPTTRAKLDAIGFGFVVPVFFVTSGLTFDARALVESPGGLAQIPVFVAALVVVRGVPALLYRRTLGTRRTLAAGLLQATSLPFVVASVMIGERLGVLTPASGAALVAAGLVSVLVFPAAALGVLRGAPPATVPTVDATGSVPRPREPVSEPERERRGGA